MGNRCCLFEMLGPGTLLDRFWMIATCRFAKVDRREQGFTIRQFQLSGRKWYMKLRLKHSCAAMLLILCVSGAAFAQRYVQMNLVSDVPGAAAVTDPNLVNPWGVSFSPTSPFWVSDNGTGLATLYNGAGTPISLVVQVPPPAGGMPPSAPTGQVFNGTTDFVVNAHGVSKAALFIFATEDGTISGWNPGVDTTHAILAVDNSGMGAVYKGLAMGSTPAGNFLYATNFRAGVVEMYDAKFQWVKNFTDWDLPPHYAPFGIANIGGMLYVTFAKQDKAKHDDAAGPHRGFVDVFDTNGNKVKRLVSRGPLNSPWGVALAPAAFGEFSNSLLVGNFGDGHISAFNPTNGHFRGQLLRQEMDEHSRKWFPHRFRHDRDDVLAIDGLWTIVFGNGTATAPTNVLYFTAGPDGESHGLFGTVQPAK